MKIEPTERLCPWDKTLSHMGLLSLLKDSGPGTLSHIGLLSLPKDSDPQWAANMYVVFIKIVV